MTVLRHLTAPFTLFAFCATLAGCGVSVSTDGSVAGGGIGGTGISSGPIDGFGSIFVNGIEFEIGSAQIVVDGVDSTEADLRLGMVVRVCGSWESDGTATTGTAVSVTYGSELEGPVSANDVGTDGMGELTVLGQTVIVDASTVWDGTTSPDQIAVGTTVEISGYNAGDGMLYATRIEVKDGGEDGEAENEIEISGAISDLNESELTFSIGALVVYYGDAEEFPSDPLANGMYVEVESSSGLDEAGRLVADGIEVEDDIDTSCSATGDDARIQGVVTTALSSDDFFAIDGETARITQDTEFENGSRADLVEGVLVEVEGYFSDGVLIVEHIDFED